MPSIYQMIVKLCEKWELSVEVEQLIYNKFKTQALSHRLGDMEFNHTQKKYTPDMTIPRYPCSRLEGYSEWSVIPRSYARYFEAYRKSGWCDSSLMKKQKSGLGQFVRHRHYFCNLFTARNPQNTYLKLHPLTLTVTPQDNYLFVQHSDFKCNPPVARDYSKAYLYELCDEAEIPYKKYWNRTKLLELLMNH